MKTSLKCETHNPKNEDAAQVVKDSRKAVLSGIPLHKDGVSRIVVVVIDHGFASDMCIFWDGRFRQKNVLIPHSFCWILHGLMVGHNHCSWSANIVGCLHYSLGLCHECDYVLCWSSTLVATPPPQAPGTKNSEQRVGICKHQKKRSVGERCPIAEFLCFCPRGFFCGRPFFVLECFCPPWMYSGWSCREWVGVLMQRGAEIQNSKKSSIGVKLLRT
jgi:hypothetical protein